MAFTEPLYALPITIAGTETITVTMTGGSTSSTYTATLTAGTYYNPSVSDVTDFDSLAKMIDDVLDAAEITAGNTATWAITSNGAKLSQTLKFVRTGDTSDVMTSIAFSPATLATTLGFTTDSITAGSELANASDDTTLTPSYQRGYVWAPRTILTRDERVPISTVATEITPVGRAVVDGYGEYTRIRHTIEFVPGPLVYLDKAAHADHYSQVDLLEQGDPNAPLEAFWTLARTQADGKPPVIWYWPADDASGTEESIVIADMDWLTDMDNVAEETNAAPLFYRVRIDAIESVTSSFTSTGETVSAIGGPYDTYADLPSAGNTHGDLAEVTGTGTAAAQSGIYSWVDTIESTSLKGWWVPDFLVRSGMRLVRQRVYDVPYSGLTGAFTPPEECTFSGGGAGTIISDTGSAMRVSHSNTTALAGSETITGTDSGATATSTSSTLDSSNPTDGNPAVWSADSGDLVSKVGWTKLGNTGWVTDYATGGGIQIEAPSATADGQNAQFRFENMDTFTAGNWTLYIMEIDCQNAASTHLESCTRFRDTQNDTTLTHCLEFGGTNTENYHAWGDNPSGTDTFEGMGYVQGSAFGTLFILTQRGSRPQQTGTVPTSEDPGQWWVWQPTDSYLPSRISGSCLNVGDFGTSTSSHILLRVRRDTGGQVLTTVWKEIVALQCMTG